MTDTTTAQTPEELAGKLDHMSDISLFYNPNDAVDLAEEASAMIRAQAAQIRRNDEVARALVASYAKAADDALARATTAEAALSASLGRERAMREALTVGGKWGVAAPCWDGAVAGGLRDWIAAGCNGPLPQTVTETLAIIDPGLSADLQTKEDAPCAHG